MPKQPATVHLWPVPGAYIPGVPAVECDVTEERAAELLAYSPPAFTTTPPETPATHPEPAPADATTPEV